MPTPRRSLQLVASIAAFASTLLLTAHGHRTAHAATYDYIRNGGFEDGVAEWSAHGADLQTDADLPSAGSLSAKLTAYDVGSFSLRQSSFADVPAGNYHLSLSIRRNSAGSDLRVSVTPADACGGPDCDSAIGSATGEWIRIDAAFALSRAGAVGITVAEFGATAGDVIHVDDVHLTGPPPATATPTDTASPSSTATPLPTGTFTKTPRPSATPNASDTPDAPATPGTASDVPPGAELRNAGFESRADNGTPADWHRYGGVLSATDADHARTGAGAARLESGTMATKWLYQTVLVEPDAGYQFDAWVLDDDTSVAAAFLRVSWYATEDGGGTAITTNDSTARVTTPSAAYRLLTTSGIAAPPSAHSARLRIMLAPSSSAAAVIYADDASWAAADLSAAASSDVAVASDDGSSVAQPAPDQATQRVLGETRKPAARTSAKTSAKTPAAPPSGAHSVVVNEVYYDPDGDGVNASDEWVELYNASPSAVTFDGWTLRDNVGATTLPAVSLEPGKFVVFAASDSFLARYSEFVGNVEIVGHIGNGLGNDGDRLLLVDDTGAAVDAISWGSDTSILDPSVTDAPTGHSIERRHAGLDTDSAADFLDNESPSPGGAILASANSKRGQGAGSTAASLVAADHSFGWLPWTVTTMAAAALAIAVAWQAVPHLAQRLRRRP